MSTCSNARTVSGAATLRSMSLSFHCRMTRWSCLGPWYCLSAEVQHPDDLAPNLVDHCRTYIASSSAWRRVEVVEVASAGRTHKSSCSSPHFSGMFSTGCPPWFGATSSLPFPVPMPASFTSVYRGSGFFAQLLDPRSFHSAPSYGCHHVSPLVQNGANMYIAGAFLYCSCCRLPIFNTALTNVACRTYYCRCQGSNWQD